MKNISIYASLMIYLNTLSCHATIQTIHSIEHTTPSVQKAISKVDNAKKIWIAFDIDGVTVDVENKLLEGVKTRKQYLEAKKLGVTVLMITYRGGQGMSLDQIKKLTDNMLLNTIVTNDDINNEILRDKEQLFTENELRKLIAIHDVEDLTHSTYKIYEEAVRANLDKIAAQYSVGLSEQFPNVPAQILEQDGELVGYFDRGIIYAEPSKPIALTTFIELINTQPSYIIYTDDHLPFLEAFNDNKNLKDRTITLLMKHND